MVLNDYSLELLLMYFVNFVLGKLIGIQSEWSLVKGRRADIMTAAENVCYTLINVTNDSEPPSEVSLKADLGNIHV